MLFYLWFCSEGFSFFSCKVKFSNNKGDLKNVFSNRKENNMKNMLGQLLKVLLLRE